METTCVHQLIYGKDVLHIYNGILPSHEGERSPAICENMNGLGGH